MTITMKMTMTTPMMMMLMMTPMPMMMMAMMMMTMMPHVSRYPQVEAEVPLLRRALQLLAIFGAPGPQKTLQHLSNVGKRTFFLL